MKINRLKKLTAIAVSVMIALGAINLAPGLLPNTAYADGETSGTCGENLTWSFDDSTGTLTISGEGDMEDYEHHSYSPWSPYIDFITNIVFDGNITSISKYAFFGCRLTSITIPDSVTSIGNNAFFNCARLTSVIIPNSVTTIGGGAFDGCTGLTNITIPDSVTNIDDYAFCGCTGLARITIPIGVTTIGFGVFSKCTGLENITVDEKNPVYYSSGNCIIETESKTLIAGCKNSVIPSDESISHIGDFAFSNCTGLTSINIPDSVTSIGDSAFSGCTGLTSIIIPDSVTSIGGYAFSRCTGLTSITIPGSVTGIGDRAFSCCSGLESITVDESNPIYHSSGNCLIETASKTLIVGCKNSVIPDDGSVTIIGIEAFCKCAELKSITIPDSVTRIVYSAFSDCTGLTEITIPDNVAHIDMFAFSGCTGLTELTIPTGTVKEGAFGNCTGLTSITIGKGVISIGSSPFSAFHYCPGLKTITVDKDNPVYHSSGNCIVETETQTLIAGCKNSIIPDDGSVTKIGYDAFDGCFELTSITIPEGITSIGEYAFRDCFALTSIVIPNSVTNIAVHAFFQCTALENITMFESITSIGTEAFVACYSLSDVYYSGSEAQWNAINIEEKNEPLLEANIHFNYKPAVNHIYDYGGYGRGMTDQIRINGADNMLKLTVTALTPQENEGFDANPYGCSLKFELAAEDEGAVISEPVEILVSKDFIGTKRDSIVVFQYVTKADGTRSRVSYTFSKNDSRYKITDGGYNYWILNVYTLSAA